MLTKGGCCWLDVHDGLTDKSINKNRRGYPWHSAVAAGKLVLVGALGIFSLLRTLLGGPFHFAL